MLRADLGYRRVVMAAARNGSTEAQKLWSAGKLSGARVAPARPTQFERLCDSLNIPSGPDGFEQQKNSAELKAFAEAQRLYRYIPEQLLEEWHLTVSENEAAWER
jgi:hypothetical protein